MLSRQCNAAKCARPLQYASRRPFTSGFNGLVRDLRALLSPYSGLDASEIDHQALQRRLEAYTSVHSEWRSYAFADFDRSYTRNLVDRCEGKANLVRHPRPLHDAFDHD